MYVYKVIKAHTGGPSAPGNPGNPDLPWGPCVTKKWQILQAVRKFTTLYDVGYKAMLYLLLGKAEYYMLQLCLVVLNERFGDQHMQMAWYKNLMQQATRRVAYLFTGWSNGALRTRKTLWQRKIGRNYSVAIAITRRPKQAHTSWMN